MASADASEHVGDVSEQLAHPQMGPVDSGDVLITAPDKRSAIGYMTLADLASVGDHRIALAGGVLKTVHKNDQGRTHYRTVADLVARRLGVTPGGMLYINGDVTDLRHSNLMCVDAHGKPPRNTVAAALEVSHLTLVTRRIEDGWTGGRLVKMTGQPFQWHNMHRIDPNSGALHMCAVNMNPTSMTSDDTVVEFVTSAQLLPTLQCYTVVFSNGVLMTMDRGSKRIANLVYELQRDATADARNGLTPPSGLVRKPIVHVDGNPLNVMPDNLSVVSPAAQARLAAKAKRKRERAEAAPPAPKARSAATSPHERPTRPPAASKTSVPLTDGMLLADGWDGPLPPVCERDRMSVCSAGDVRAVRYRRVIADGGVTVLDVSRAVRIRPGGAKGALVSAVRRLDPCMAIVNELVVDAMISPPPLQRKRKAPAALPKRENEPAQPGT